MGILEKIKDIEAEIARTQKNKATEHHLGMLKAKLAKYPHPHLLFISQCKLSLILNTFRTQLLEPTGKGGAKVCRLIAITLDILEIDDSFYIPRIQPL